MASAQVKSALLLAALSASGTTTVRSPGPSRDHTERMLESMGVRLGRAADGAGHTVSLAGPAALRGGEVLRAGGFQLGGVLHRRGLPRGARRLADRERRHQPDAHRPADDPARDGRADRAAQRAQRSAPSPSPIYGSCKASLRGIVVPPELVPLAIDEFPILFIAAAAAKGDDGRQRRRGAAQEGNRPNRRDGARARRPSASRSRSGPTARASSAARMRGGTVDSRGDHRIAMSFAVASVRAGAPIEILNTAEVATSFPNFLDVAQRRGPERHGGGPRVTRSGVRVVTIDGPSGSGKGTIGRLLAQKLGWHYLDSGALYRLVALAALAAPPRLRAMRRRWPRRRRP